MLEHLIDSPNRGLVEVEAEQEGHPNLQEAGEGVEGAHQMLV